MWSDAARASSLQARGGSFGGAGSAPATSGTSSIGPAGNVSGGSQGIQGRLAQAGANSRGQWAKGKAGKQPTQRVTITGPAHQQGVNAITPNMRSGGKPISTMPPAYYSNVARNSYGYGNAGMPGM